MMSGAFKAPVNELQQTDIQLSSLDRISGVPGRYRINVDPVIKGIQRIEFKSFVGDLKAFNVILPAVYKIQSFTPGPGIIAITSYNQIFTEGAWNLMDLLTLLNINPYVQFTYNQQSGRVIVTRLITTSTATQITGLDNATPQGAVIGRLIGFPQGFSLAPAVMAVQSVFMVPLLSIPQSILIGFDDWPTGIVTSGQKAGTFVVPIDADTFDAGLNKITFRDQSDFTQSVFVNNKTVDNIGVNIQDANLGSPMIDVGEHVMVLRIYSSGNTV